MRDEWQRRKLPSKLADPVRAGNVEARECPVRAAYVNLVLWVWEAVDQQVKRTGECPERLFQKLKRARLRA
jgi:hypothetical protein